jgi:predicted Zn-dependent peptidase
MLDRSKPPIPDAAATLPFPTWQTVMLSNGLKIIVYEHHQTPMATLRLYVKAGSANEGAAQKAASFAFALLTQGTASRTADQIADETEFLGADLSAGAGIDHSTVSLSIMTKFLDKGLDLFADVILQPSFPDKEIEFVRRQSLNRLKFSKADAVRLGTDAFLKAVYQSHPYAQPPLGTEPSLKNLTRLQLETFYFSNAAPNNAFITVAGDVDTADIVKKLEQRFSTWPPKPLETAHFEPPLLYEEPQVILIQKDGAVQSSLHIGHLGVPRAHPDYIKIYVMNMILGGYFGSRLNLNLREKQGFTYSIRSAFEAKKLLGDFSISAQVRTDVTADAVKEIVREVRRLIQDDIMPDELQAVKNYISGNFVIQNEQPDAIAGRIATMELYGLPPSYFDSYRDAINAVSLADVRDAANAYIHLGNLLFVASGNALSIRKSMAEFGQTSILDADGNELTI